jgi:hypothetical protein
MTTPLKVLLVTDYGTPTGGDEILSLDLRDVLRARGHDARLFTTNARSLPLPVLSDYTCTGTTSRWRTLLQSANPFAFTGLKRVLKRFDPDVVHVRSFLTQLSPLILMLLRNRPTVIHFDTLRAICPSGSKLLPRGGECDLERGQVCRREGCVPAQDWLALSLQLAASDRLLNNVDHLCIANSAYTLEAVLLRAAALTLREKPDTTVIIAGDGPQRPALEKLAHALGIASRVEFTGHLSREALDRRIGGAWVHVVPSLWPEPFGLVTIEAMARGTAVVTTATGASVELIRDGNNGLLVPPNDEVALARTLSRLIDAPQQAAEIGRRAREFVVSKASLDAFADAVERMYYRLLDARDGPAPAATRTEADRFGAP